MKGLILLAGLLASGALAQPARIIGAPAGSGNWPAVAEARSDAPGYTVYRPASSPKGQPPLLLWGNGGCRNNRPASERAADDAATGAARTTAAGHG